MGLYMNPPTNAVVLSVDEKSQIQAQDRTLPRLPLRPGRICNRTHDYKRNGTVCLYTAFNTLTGEVMGKVTDNQRSKEFLSFFDSPKAPLRLFFLFKRKIVFFNLSKPSLICLNCTSFSFYSLHKGFLNHR